MSLLKYSTKLTGLCARATAVVASVFAVYAPPGTTWAEDADTPSTEIEEILVTARRQTESSQIVPIAITSIDQQALERQSIKTLTDLQLIVPSAYVSQYAHGSGQQFFSLRGQSESGLNTGGGAGGGPAVVGYFSEVPTQMSGPGLYYEIGRAHV